MTQDGLKKLDKRLQQIQNPFETGFQMLINCGEIAPRIMGSPCVKLAASMQHGR